MKGNSLSPRRSNPFLHEDTDDTTLSNNLSCSLSENNFMVVNHYKQILPNINENSPVDVLEEAVKQCKSQILQLMGVEEKHRNRYIERLIELNRSLYLAKEQLKEINKLENTSILDDSKILRVLLIAGHRLQRARQGLKFHKPKFCEVCAGLITTGRSFYYCSECIINLHASEICVQRLQRQCPAAPRRRMSSAVESTNSSSNLTNIDDPLSSYATYSSCILPQNPSFQIDIQYFPLTGSLSQQNFCCAECNRAIRPSNISGRISKNTSPIPHNSSNGSINSLNRNTLSSKVTSSRRSIGRFCNYYRKYYCSSCHWNNTFPIPSVFFILGTTERLPVSRNAYIKLKYCWSRALFRGPDFWLQQCSIAKEILNIRLRLLKMRRFRTCSILFDQILSNYPDWIIDQPYLMTLEFVYATQNPTNNACGQVQILYSSMLSHIVDCQTCQEMCTVCHICQEGDRLVPGSKNVWSCHKCTFYMIHEMCAQKTLLSIKEESEYLCLDCDH